LQHSGPAGIARAYITQYQKIGQPHGVTDCRKDTTQTLNIQLPHDSLIHNTAHKASRQHTYALSAVLQTQSCHFCHPRDSETLRGRPALSLRPQQLERQTCTARIPELQKKKKKDHRAISTKQNLYPSHLRLNDVLLTRASTSLQISRHSSDDFSGTYGKSPTRDCKTSFKIPRTFPGSNLP
jgi:hypothetical protein